MLRVVAPTKPRKGGSSDVTQTETLWRDPPAKRDGKGWPPTVSESCPPEATKVWKRRQRLQKPCEAASKLTCDVGVFAINVAGTERKTEWPGKEVRPGSKSRADAEKWVPWEVGRSCHLLRKRENREGEPVEQAPGP